MSFLTNMVDAAGTIKYNNIGQLKVSAASLTAERRGYTYDAAWNMTWMTNVSPFHYQVNVLNEVTNGPGRLNRTYDGNGSLTNVDDRGDVMYTYTWDDENRLVRLVYNDPAESSEYWYRSDWVYSGLGRARVRTDYTWSGSAWVPAGTNEYVYDGMRVIQERNGGNVPTVSYTRGPDLSGTMEGAGGIGGLLARSSGYSAGNWTSHAYYHADGNGNVMCLINSAQTKVASYRYDPFGNTVTRSGTLADANTYRFSSKEIHPKSGLYYYGERFYDPYMQRWPNRDSFGEPGFELLRGGEVDLIGDGPYLYQFVANSPVNLIDPFGLALEDDVKAAEKAAEAARKAWQSAQEFLKGCKDPREAELAREQAVKLLDEFGKKQARLRELKELLRLRGMGGFVNTRMLVRGGGVVGAGLAGYAGGRALGGSTPYPGGGTIDENVQDAVFIPFWDWWYKPNSCTCRK